MAHNLKVTGSNPVPATKISLVISYLQDSPRGAFCVAKSPGSTAEAKGREVLCNKAKIKSRKRAAPLGPPAPDRPLALYSLITMRLVSKTDTRDQNLPADNNSRWRLDTSRYGPYGCWTCAARKPWQEVWNCLNWPARCRGQAESRLSTDQGKHPARAAVTRP